MKGGGNLPFYSKEFDMSKGHREPSICIQIYAHIEVFFSSMNPVKDFFIRVTNNSGKLESQGNLEHFWN